MGFSPQGTYLSKIVNITFPKWISCSFIIDSVMSWYKLSKITEIYISLTTLYSEQNWVFSRTLKVGYYQKVLEIKIQLSEAVKSHVWVSNSKPSVLNLLNLPQLSRTKRRNAENKMNKSLSLNSELELLTIRQLIFDKLVFSLNAGFCACRWRKTRDLIRSWRMRDGLFHSRAEKL